MNDFFDRLDTYMKSKGLNDNQMTVQAGLSVGALGKQRKGSRGLSNESIARILHAYEDLSADWLILGKGVMIRSNNGQAVAKQVHDTDTISNYIPAESTADEPPKIPLVSISAVAGFGNADFAIQQSDVKDYYVVPKFKDRRIDFMIEVAGSSMYPKYNSGDVVACTILRESRFIQWNKVHLIGTVEQGILIKRVKKGQDDQHLLLISDNKDYDPFVINIDEVTGMALVVGVIRLE